MEPDPNWQSSIRDLYEQYADVVYSRCYWELAGDAAAAEDALQATFVVAMDRWQRGGPDLANVKAWLLTVAHSQAIDQMRRRTEIISAEPRQHDDQEATAIDVEVLNAMDATAAAALLNAAMRALEDDNRRILSLHLQEQSGALNRSDVNEVLASEVGLAPAAVKKRIFELRKPDGILAQAIVLVLLLPTRRRDCPALSQLVDQFVTVTPRLRKAVAAHIRQCADCDRRRRALAPFVPGVASAAPRLQPSPAAAARLFAAIDAAQTTPPPATRRHVRRRRASLLVVALLLVLLIIGTAVGVNLASAGRHSAVPDTPITTPAGTTTTSPVPSSSQSSQPATLPATSRPSPTKTATERSTLRPSPTARTPTQSQTTRRTTPSPSLDPTKSVDPSPPPKPPVTLSELGITATYNPVIQGRLLCGGNVLCVATLTAQWDPANGTSDDDARQLLTRQATWTVDGKARPDCHLTCSVTPTKTENLQTVSITLTAANLTAHYAVKVVWPPG